jgi:hypothetical protein
MSAGDPSSTGASIDNAETILCFLRFLLFKSERDGDTDFKFLARDTVLAAGKPELREYKAVFVVADKEVSQFSDEVTVKCAPLV